MLCFFISTALNDLITIVSRLMLTPESLVRIDSYAYCFSSVFNSGVNSGFARFRLTATVLVTHLLPSLTNLYDTRYVISYGFVFLLFFAGPFRMALMRLAFLSALMRLSYETICFSTCCFIFCSTMAGVSTGLTGLGIIPFLISLARFRFCTRL